MEAERTVVTAVICKKHPQSGAAIEQSIKRDAYTSCCCRKHDISRQATEIFEYESAGADLQYQAPKAETCGTRLRTCRCS